MSRFFASPVRTPDESSGSGGAQARSSIKETFVSIIISFAMAFVFRGFVVEAFLIPTGSMAPTLLGAHMRFQSPESGVSWAGNYQQTQRFSPNPVKVQNSVAVEDPVTGVRTERNGVPLRWGDRIFVMKYLAGVYAPRRWDCVVFKNPTDPTVNYIKRLVGLPGEQVALFDGDVFTRTPLPTDDAGANPWSLDGWKAAHKPETAQRAMWQLIFDSAQTPLVTTRDGRSIFSHPWTDVSNASAGKGWTFDNDGRYEYSGIGPTVLRWNTADRPIVDYYSYNVNYRDTGGDNGRFPVGDLRLRGAVRPGTSGVSAACVVQTRGVQFRGRVSGTGAHIETRERVQGTDDQWGPWSTLAQSELSTALKAGTVTTIDLWHADQRLQLWVDEQKVLEAEYGWSLEERVRRTLNAPLKYLSSGDNSFTRHDNYPETEVWWEFDGGALRLERVTMWRDIYYQPDTYEPADPRAPRTTKLRPALATDPSTTLTLTGEQFFVCGDNSPASLDARKWGPPHPWVAEIDPTTGVVHRDLMIGKAFFVYFPAPYKVYGLPVPDVGRMRWIW
jgi:signal peptidase I